MASILFVCRDAREDSVLSNVVLALEMRKSGDDAAIVFTGESLRAIAGEARYWPPLLKARTTVVGLARAGKEMGYEMTAEFDARWIDSERLLRHAASQGLPLLACPIWSRLLGVEGNLPDYMTEIALDSYLDRIRDARQVIGGF